MVNQITPASSPHPAAASIAPKVAVTRQAPSGTPAIHAQAQGPGSQEAAVAQVNQHLEQGQTDLKLQVDAGSGRTVFQVVQQGTGQVVLQVPSEEVLGMSRRMREMESQSSGSGALVDKKG